jgi:Zn-dependent oligopeptidase
MLLLAQLLRKMHYRATHKINLNKKNLYRKRLQTKERNLTYLEGLLKISTELNRVQSPIEIRLSSMSNSQITRVLKKIRSNLSKSLRKLSSKEALKTLSSSNLSVILATS